MAFSRWGLPGPSKTAKTFVDCCHRLATFGGQLMSSPGGMGDVNKALALAKKACRFGSGSSCDLVVALEILAR